MYKLRWTLLVLLGTPLSFLFADDLPPSKQGKETTGLVNPSSRYQVSNGWNFFLNTEFLWWVAKGEGFYYAQTGATSSIATPSNGEAVFDGSIAKVEPRFRPGFRIGFGGNMEYDDWDILLNWTWFSSHANGSKSGTLLPLWGYPNASSRTASFARAKWDLGLNVCDLEMGRSFWVGKHLSLRPFIAARGAWIDQDFHIRYDLTTTPSTNTHVDALSDFSGGGVRMGADLRFTLIGGWSFYTVASASLLYGFYNCDFSEKWDGLEIADANNRFRQGVSNGQLELGVRWDTYLHRDRYHIGLYAGWEQNIWFGMNKMSRYFGSLEEGNFEQMNADLTLSGGTFGVRFDF